MQTHSTVAPRLRLVVLLALAVTGGLCLALPAAADCDHRAQRELTAALDGATSIEIRARAGDLSVRPGDDGAGESGAGESRIVAKGTACASSAALLREVKLTSSRSGDVLVVEVEVPETSGWRQSAALDLTVAVPPSVPVAIRDSSGDIDLRGITVASIEDSSGDLDGRDLMGDFTVTDSSGDVDLRALGGSIELTDSSGDIEIEGIRGSVVVRADSSGDIEIEDVLGSVTVHKDSSGDIEVARVVGDFTVDQDGSGSIRHVEVGGRVDVPAD